MEKTIRFTGKAVPLERSDVDTDQIIPSDWLKRVERTGFGAGLFSEWREDPSFILNDERYSKATILVAGENFGTGSSREHAVWALMDYGFRAVLSFRFGDIFFNNSTKAGLVPVKLSEDEIKTLQKALIDDPTLEITVDIEALSVAAPSIGFEAKFILNEFTRYRFLEGLDDIGLTLAKEAEISAFEANRPAFYPNLSR
ncbi:MAG: 3-isopropylmalate dehydratase small subunit [Actinomycetota bacterium]|jgi:3-isopropylmalate/(R)-2-methylmalate dehydratase small subunit|nr:3-isopropylmalate dehydratase small subunit [Actinomycetota bacterium]